MKWYYLSVISGRRKGAISTVFNGFLAILSFFYELAHRTRHFLYRTGIFRSVRLPCPVISVGNLTAGGTGKTPMVEHIAHALTKRNLRVAILARGYGREVSGYDDEDLISEASLENIIRLVGRDRVALARRALSSFRADIVILDDGYQHFRIDRDLDLLMIDATNPFAGEHLIPRGLLRERPHAIRRADLVILTHVDQVPQEVQRDLFERVRSLSPTVPILEAVHHPISVRSLTNKRRYEIESLKGRTVYAFAGIGNPDSFHRTLESVGASVVKFRAFPDHHGYSADDLRLVNAEAQEFMAELLVTTEKDSARLHPEAFELPVAALRIELELVRGEEILEERLDALARRVVRPAAAIHR